MRRCRLKGSPSPKQARANLVARLLPPPITPLPPPSPCRSPTPTPGRPPTSKPPSCSVSPNNPSTLRPPLRSTRMVSRSLAVKGTNPPARLGSARWGPTRSRTSSPRGPRASTTCPFLLSPFPAVSPKHSNALTLTLSFVASSEGPREGGIGCHPAPGARARKRAGAEEGDGRTRAPATRLWARVARSLAASALCANRSRCTSRHARSLPLGAAKERRVQGSKNVRGGRRTRVKGGGGEKEVVALLLIFRTPSRSRLGTRANGRVALRYVPRAPLPTHARTHRGSRGTTVHGCPRREDERGSRGEGLGLS